MKQHVTGLMISALLLGCGQPEYDSAEETSVATNGTTVTLVTAAKIMDADPQIWLSHGRAYDEQRFSPLAHGMAASWRPQATWSFKAV